MDVFFTLSIIAFFGLILVFALKQRASPGHTRRCPNCGEPLPMMRKPTNTRQMMWGGWTCTRCDAELDRSARVIREGRPDAALLSGGLEQHEGSDGQGALSESATATGSLDLHERDIVLDLADAELTDAELADAHETSASSRRT